MLRQRKAPEQHTPPAAKKRRINQKQAEAVTTPIGSVKPASKKSTPGNCQGYFKLVALLLILAW